MAKIKIEVCELCKREKCKGILYETEKWLGSASIICSSNRDLRKKDGLLFYHIVRGHGDSYDIKVFEVFSNGKVSKEQTVVK